jgi:hypothetical protein
MEADHAGRLQIGAINAQFSAPPISTGSTRAGTDAGAVADDD